MSELIEGKVARILNSRDVVINRGSHDGVREGMRFAILDSAGDSIVDPDTGEALGSVQRTKVEVEAIQIEDRLTVARTFRFKTVNEGGHGNQFLAGGEISRLFAPPKLIKRYETFKMSEADWEPLSESESIVEVGDVVVQTSPADNDAPTTGVIRPAE